MSERKTLICDVCKRETKGPLFWLNIEKRHQGGRGVRANPGPRKVRGFRRRRMQMYELDVCGSCTKKPVTLAALIAAAVEPVDD